MAAERAARGVTRRRRGPTAGRPCGPFPLDPVPRIVPAARVGAGRGRGRAAAPGAQRLPRRRLPRGRTTAGRRRPGAARWCAPACCPSGPWRTAPAGDPDAVGQAWPGQPRADGGRAPTCCAPPTATWVVAADHLRVPAGLGLRAGQPGQRPRPRCRSCSPAAAPADPWDAVPLLRAGLAAAAPPACTGTPRIAVLTAGESDNAWFEHRLLADALGRAAGRGPRTSGRAWTAGSRWRSTACGTPVDVLYRRFDDGMLGAFRTPIGQPLDVLLTEAVRAGPARAGQRAGQRAGRRRRHLRLGAGDDPLLPGRGAAARLGAHLGARRRGAVGAGARPAARARGQAGRRLRRAGRRCSARPARPRSSPRCRRRWRRRRYRFVAQEPVEASTVPTLVDGAPAAPAAWTCGCSRWPARRHGAGAAGAADPGRAGAVARRRHGGGSKDTWLLG